MTPVWTFWGFYLNLLLCGCYSGSQFMTQWVSLMKAAAPWAWPSSMSSMSWMCSW